MSTIKIVRQHTKTKEQILKILDDLSKNPAATYISWKWVGDDKLVCKGESGLTKGCDGTLIMRDGSIELTLNLPLGLSLFKKTVEDKMNEHITELLK